MNDSGSAHGNEILRAQIRELIKRGKLPDRLPDCTWGGPGTGTPCAVCGAAVGAKDIGLEIELARDGTGDADSQQFHVPCYRELELELDKLELARRAMSSNGGIPPAAASVAHEDQERA